LAGLFTIFQLFSFIREIFQIKLVLIEFFGDLNFASKLIQQQ